MRYGSVCSGIESASVAWGALGWTAAWFAENDKAPSKLLARRFPDVVNYGDMTALPDMVGRGEIEAPDVLVGGTPCQDFSIAGMRAGLAGVRGQLTMTYVELADAIDEQRPGDECVVCWENVPGVLNHKDNPFGNFLAALAGEDVPLVPSGKRWPDAGVVLGPRRAIAWRCLDAQYFGLAQRRKRVFVVASARDGFDPGAVLLEFQGVRRDTPPSREAGQGVAGTLDARTDGGGFPGTDGACADHVVPVCPTLRAGGNSTGGDRPPGTDVDTADSLVAVAFVQNSRDEVRLMGGDGAIAGALAAEPGMKQQTLLAFTQKDHGQDASVDVAPTLRAMQGARPNGGGQVAVCVTGAITHTLKAEGLDASEDGTGRGQPIVPQMYSIMPMNSGKDYKAREVDIAQPLMAGGPVGGNQGGDYVLHPAMAVRRLMPVECERLQGFPDGWTAGQADGPRYKQLGNSKAVPVVRWIGRRIAAEYALTRLQRRLRELASAF